MVFSDEATTCHIFALFNPDTRLWLMCHFDGNGVDVIQAAVAKFAASAGLLMVHASFYC